MDTEFKHKMVAGTVVYKDTDRLIKWIDHWSPLVDKLIVLDQCRSELPPEVPQPENLTHIMVTPNGNPDLHWNTLMSVVGEGYLLRLGSDEFMDDEVLHELRCELDEYPTPVLWWMRRKNMIDGINRSDLFAFGDGFVSGDPEGYDWQPAITKHHPSLPQAVVYQVKMHTMPQVTAPPELVAFADPKRFYIDHLRTSKMVKDANRKRETFLDGRGRAIQDKFLNDMKMKGGKQ